MPVGAICPQRADAPQGVWIAWAPSLIVEGLVGATETTTILHVHRCRLASGHACLHECGCSYTWWSVALEVPNLGRPTRKRRVVVSNRPTRRRVVTEEMMNTAEAAERSRQWWDRQREARAALRGLFQ